MYAQKAGRPRSERTWLTMKDFFPFDDSLAWKYEALPSDEKVFLELLVRDFKGDSDFVYYSQP
jgi:hypothetical protein